MFILLRSFLKRLALRKKVLFAYIVMTVIALMAGLSLGQQTLSYTIAADTDIEVQDTENMHVIHVQEAPKQSEFVSQTYDAYVYKEQGQLHITTLKNEQDKANIANMLAGSEIESPIIRGKGVTVLGYIMMFVMMQAIVYMMLFGDDKEKHVLERLQVTPMRKITYISTTVLFAAAATFLPAFLCLSAAHFMGVAIGFTLTSFGILLGIISLLAVSFSFFINTLIQQSDTANMICSAVFILTSALSGCFMELHVDRWLNNILSCIPQKHIFIIAKQFERASWNVDASYSLLYIIICIIIFMVLALFRCKTIFQAHN